MRCATGSHSHSDENREFINTIRRQLMSVAEILYLITNSIKNTNLLTYEPVLSHILLYLGFGSEFNSVMKWIINFRVDKN